MGDLRGELWVVPVIKDGWESRKLYAMPACWERTEGLREQPSEAFIQPFDLGVPSEQIEPRSTAQVVGRRIQAARVRAGMTQTTLCEQLQGSFYQADISKWERGRQGTSIITLYRLAWALGIGVQDLV